MKDTLVVDPKEDYSLQPQDFYNDITKKIAIKFGPFKQNDEDTPPFITKGPIKMENGARYIGQFSNGMRNGKGKQVWDDFTLY